MTQRFAQLLLAAAAIAASLATAARATFHEWVFAEVYSNASGTVQFIEMANAFAGESELQGISLQSSSQAFAFPSDLPLGTPTADQRLLLATPGYFQLAGVPAADYNLGVNNFFDLAGDTLVFSGGLDSIAFGAAELPLDDLHSLVRETRESPLSTAVNSPTNFGGQSGAFSRWQNLDNRFNVNALGDITPVDVLQVVNELLTEGSHVLPEPSGNRPPPYYDVSGDNAVSPQDVLQVVNRILARSGDNSLAAPSVVSVQASAAAFSVPEPPGQVLALCGALLLVAGIAARRLPRAGNRRGRAL